MAPWCGHCQKIKPEWDQLQREYADHDSIIVAEFDCTTDSGKSFCKNLDVKGFPTFMYGYPTALQIYRGKRDYGSLKAHIQLELDFPCRPDCFDRCTAKQKMLLDKYMKMDDDELEDKIDEAYGALFDAEEEFEIDIQELNESRRKLKENLDATLKALKEEIDWMREIRSSRPIGGSKNSNKQDLSSSEEL
jgi:thiol-disulfide isomerase/thioredoxin